MQALADLRGCEFEYAKAWAKAVWLQAKSHRCTVDAVLALRHQHFLQRRRAQYARASIAALSDGEEDEEDEEEQSAGAAAAPSPAAGAAAPQAAAEAKTETPPSLAAAKGAAPAPASAHAPAVPQPTSKTSRWLSPANQREFDAMMDDVRRFMAGVLLLLLLAVCSCILPVFLPRDRFRNGAIMERLLW